MKRITVSCSRCGNCCRVPLVPVTHRDLARLMKRTGKAAGGIVRFCPFSEMEFDPESGIWIDLSYGRRAMVLRRRGGRCLFQTEDRACSVYPARPQTCRTFPHSVAFDDDDRPSITINDILKCKSVKRRYCDDDLNVLLGNVRRENREDAEYHRLVKKWNARTVKGGVDDFLRYLGF